MTELQAPPLRVYLITDNTCSMGQSCISSQQASPEVLAIGNLITGAQCVTVGVIGDYDNNTPDHHQGGFSLMNPETTSVQAQREWFAKYMHPCGGGGIPEAYKTALNFLLRELPGILFLFLDAPPHGIHRFDNEGLKERDFLAQNGMIQDWDELVQAVKQAGFRTVIFVTGNMFRINPSFYAVYAQLGHIVEIETNKADVISATMLQTLYQLLGQTVSPSNIVYGSWNSIHGTKEHSSTLQPYITVDLKEKLRSANPELVLDVFNQLLMPQDAQRVKCLTTNPILGKYWRMICGNYRVRDNGKYEQKCQEVMNKLAKLVGNISDPNEQKHLQDWIRDSHDNVELIHQLINKDLGDGMSTQHVYTTNRILFIPEENRKQVTRDDVLELGRGGKYELLATIIADIQVRAQEHKIHFDDDDQNTCPRFIPFDTKMKPETVMCLLGNLLSHKMAFSKTIALVASVLCLSNQLLATIAHQFLTDNIGTWIDWSLDTENKQKSPMFWSNNFMKLLKLAPNDVLTREEIDFRNHYHFVAHVSYMRHVRIDVTLPIITGDRLRQGVTWKRLCDQTNGGCGQMRCFTIFPGDSKLCGLCMAFHNEYISNKLEQVIDAKNHKEKDPNKIAWAQCHICHANYGIVNSEELKARPKCHACRVGVASFCKQCTHCKLLYCNPGNSAILAFNQAKANGFVPTDCSSTFICPRCVEEPNHCSMQCEISVLKLMENNPKLELLVPLTDYKATINDESTKFWKRVWKSSSLCLQNMTCERTTKNDTYIDHELKQTEITEIKLSSKDGTTNMKLSHNCALGATESTDQAVKTLSKSPLGSEQSRVKDPLYVDGFEIHNPEYCVAKIKELIGTNAFLPTATCSLCLSDISWKQLKPACGNCNNSICEQCIKHWYDDCFEDGNLKGNIISENHTKCPFCKACVKYDVIKRLNLRHVRNIRPTSKLPLCTWDPAFIYCVCMDCRCAKPAFPRVCAANFDDLVSVGKLDFRCNICIFDRASALQNALSAPECKACPGCSAPTSKNGGCNHMTCANCHAHWCWTCGKNKSFITGNVFTGLTIYDHMVRCGGIFPRNPAVHDDDMHVSDSDSE